MHFQDQLYTVDGARANHVMQWLRTDLLLPIRGRLAIGWVVGAAIVIR